MVHIVVYAVFHCRADIFVSLMFARLFIVDGENCHCYELAELLLPF